MSFDTWLLHTAKVRLLIITPAQWFRGNNEARVEWTAVGRLVVAPIILGTRTNTRS